MPVVSTVSLFLAEGEREREVRLISFLLFLKIAMKSVQVDDELTDLSWLVQMNHSNEKQSYPTFPEPNAETKTKKFQRMPKPLAVINGPTSSSSRASLSALSHYQHANEENHFETHPSMIHPGVKRKCAPTIAYHSTKRFHTEQTLPIYPTPSELIYYEPPALASRPSTTSSRYMLLKNDPSLSDTVPTVPMNSHFHSSTMILEEDTLYSDDIEHLLDIFKNEVELIGLDPIASTSAGDGTLDISHCLSSNEFCTY